MTREEAIAARRSIKVRLVAVIACAAVIGLLMSYGAALLGHPVYLWWWQLIGVM